MRALALLAALLLVSCQAPTWGGAADILTPDEFTMGQGSSEYAWAGGHLGSDPAYSYDGENESTYAALTWNLPTWEGREGGMDREAQRNMAILLDKMVADEIGELDEETGEATVGRLDDIKMPPVWVLVGVGLVLAFLVLSAMKKSRRSTWR